MASTEIFFKEIWSKTSKFGLLQTITVTGNTNGAFFKKRIKDLNVTPITDKSNWDSIEKNQEIIKSHTGVLLKWYTPPIRSIIWVWLTPWAGVCGKCRAPGWPLFPVGLWSLSVRPEPLGGEPWLSPRRRFVSTREAWQHQAKVGGVGGFSFQRSSQCSFISPWPGTDIETDSTKAWVTKELFVAFILAFFSLSFSSVRMNLTHTRITRSNKTCCLGHTFLFFFI